MSSNIEKELDFADYDKDEPEENKATAKDGVKVAGGKVAVQAVAGTVAVQTADVNVAVQVALTQEEIEAFMTRMTTEDKDRVLVVVYGVSYLRSVKQFFFPGSSTNVLNLKKLQDSRRKLDVYSIKFNRRD